MKELTQKILKQLLNYDADTGVFTWKSSRGGRFKGATAGMIGNKGYTVIRVNGKLYLSHRLAWLYVTGKFPDFDIDHMNGLRSDNRLTNLRLASRSENNQNRSIQGNNASGFVGVSYHKPTKKWRAYIVLNRKQKHLGMYNTPEEAYNAYLFAKSELHHFQPIPRNLLENINNEV